MSKFIGYSTFLILAHLCIACQKEEQPNQKFIGRWIASDFSDTMIILTDDLFERPHDYYYDQYNYSFSKDSFTIHYIGPDKIAVFPVSNKYMFLQDTLLIDYKTNYHPRITKGLRKYLKK